MTYLEAAQRLAIAAERARERGDTVRSIELALEAAQFLRAARALDELKQAAGSQS